MVVVFYFSQISGHQRVLLEYIQEELKLYCINYTKFKCRAAEGSSFFWEMVFPEPRKTVYHLGLREIFLEFNCGHFGIKIESLLPPCQKLAFAHII